MRQPSIATSPIMGIRCLVQVILASVLATGFYSSSVNGQPIYYVAPTDAMCHGLHVIHMCATLHNYTANPKDYFVSGATFVFLPGNHSLANDGFVIIRDIQDLSLGGLLSASILLFENDLVYDVNPHAIVSCTFGNSGLAFLNVSNFQIRNLGFSMCGAIIPPDLATEALSVQTKAKHNFGIPKNRLKAALFLINVHFFTMTGVLVKNSTGYGLLGINVIGTVFFDRSLFLNNNLYTYNSFKCNFPNSEADKFDCIGGNARLIYSDPATCPLSGQTYTIYIRQSTYKGGIDILGSMLDRYWINRGSGLGISFTQNTYGVSLVLQQVAIYGNTGREGANLYLVSLNRVENTTVEILSSLISHGNAMYYPAAYSSSMVLNSIGVAGVGLCFIHGAMDNVDIFSPDKSCNRSENTGEATQKVLVIYNSSFTYNIGAKFGAFGAGIRLSIFPHLNSQLKRVITIDRAFMYGNNGSTGVGLYMLESVASQKVDISITDSVFLDNVHHIPIDSLLSRDGRTYSVQFDQRGTLTFLTAQNVTITDCRFILNGLSAISATDSRLIFRGDNLFLYNVGSTGGAISAIGDTVLFLRPHVHMNFTGNAAVQRGGAIYVANNYAIDAECFLQVDDPAIRPTSQLDISLTFRNNTAKEAGDVLYGGALDRCFASTPSGFLFFNGALTGGEIFDEIAELKQETTTSVISSSPEGACFCTDGQPDWELQKISMARFPGQSFNVTLVAIGQRRGTVPALIRSYFFASNTAETKLGKLQEVQQAQRHCQNLTYTVFSRDNLVIITFVPDNPLPVYTTPIVELSLLPCPVGFKISHELGTCLCTQQLQQRNVTCDIERETITRKPPYWFSAATGELAIHDHCPFDYCRDETVEMNLSEPDTQCAFERSGVLCGECGDGLSLSLGTSNCKKCSNWYLLLLIPFAIMGILLVVLLSLLNFNVRVGTINGIIFYANVVKINQSAFFSPGEVSFFTVFLSWLNLDLGIESCFFDGLDAYSKTWLQFAFPLYIWAIGIAIIVSARYSTRISEIFSNSVHVLDTLFLLSYAKILRAIITALSFTFVEYQGSSGDETAVVWLSDGNMKYGEGKHIALIIFASIFLLLAFPYTLVLLFVQLFHRYSNKQGLKWVSTIKPFLDSYTGPYKAKHKYWTGLLLLVRIVFVLVFAFNVLGDPAVNIMVVTIVSFLLAALVFWTEGVYQNWVLGVLEASLFLNLGILSVAINYINNAGGSQYAAVYTSVAIVLIEFLAILMYHFLLQVKKRFNLQPRLASVVVGYMYLYMLIST